MEVFEAPPLAKETFVTFTATDESIDNMQAT